MRSDAERRWVRGRAAIPARALSLAAAFHSARATSALSRRLTIGLAAAALAGCGGATTRTVRLEAYTAAFCTAIAPLERDARRLGTSVSTEGLLPRSLRSRRAREGLLATLSVDAENVVNDLRAEGVPKVSDGESLAAETIMAFRQMALSYSAWRSEIQRGRSVPRVLREPAIPVVTALRARVAVGQALERLPLTQERERAMAASPVCRNAFGPTQ
jgi:hypothetical protein